MAQIPTSSTGTNEKQQPLMVNIVDTKPQGNEHTQKEKLDGATGVAKPQVKISVNNPRYQHTISKPDVHVSRIMLVSRCVDEG